MADKENNTRPAGADQGETTVNEEGQEVRPTGQQTVFPKSASEEPGLPPNVAGASPAGPHGETEMPFPRIDDPPGVTGIDRGGDPGVPAFIPDTVGPRTDADYAAPTLDEREDAADTVAEQAKADNAAGERAARASKAKK